MVWCPSYGLVITEGIINSYSVYNKQYLTAYSRLKYTVLFDGCQNTHGITVWNGFR